MPISLVTGGAGFMGSHVVAELLKNGHQVIVLDDLSGGFIDNVPSQATFLEGSILDFEQINHIFKKYSFTYVYHLAAYAAEGLSHFIKRFNYNNNLVGSVNIINACVNHKVKSLVFTSSIAVYGAGVPPLREDMVPVPEDSYGIAKLAVEQELKVSHEMFGLDYVIFRPHNVYGERQNIGDRYRNVIGIFMNQILRGEPLTVFGDGTQIRAFTYINDIAPIIARSVDVPAARNQVFNIGTDIAYPINDMAMIVAEVMGAKPEIVHLDPRNEVKIAFSDHSKAYRVFGKQPQTSFRDGVHAMAHWVKTHGAREGVVFEDIEVRKNLPASWAHGDQKSVSV